MADMKPWRELIAPHPDVAGGRYDQAEFAADLAQVVRGDAEPEYQDPREFFARTYLTESMRRLLVVALQRLAGRGGEPVVQLKTAFGGGKSHTLLALLHLIGGQAEASQLLGVSQLLKDAGVAQVPTVSKAVVVGTAISASRPRVVKGVTVRTLWGDIAAQLGGAEAYAIVEEADQHSVAPGGDDLLEVLSNHGPAAIIIDELVAYARNLYGATNLSGGSFDSNMTFIQALTEAVRRSRNSILVASIPESEIEIGQEAGHAALERIAHTFGRLEAIWKPVGAMEGFEIVRRRLFTPARDEDSREAVCRAFSQLYDENPSDFPRETREGAYLDRLRQAYPIHPELFDRLYGDWSSLESFQRTRGVLRLMAGVIHHLWVSGDSSYLIMPGSVPVQTPRVLEELLRYLPEGWNAVVDSDVDGDNSLSRRIDEESPRFGAASAARRVARAIFLGSAPHVRSQNVRGVEDVRLRLGVVQPGESVALFNDALGRLVDRSTHLYGGSRRYWYDTRPNLRRTVEDRAQRLDKTEVEDELGRRLRSARQRGEFRAVHVFASSGDIPDEQVARLVVLPPSAPHRGRREATPAINAAQDILDRRGNGPRSYRNMLLFLAADADAVSSLETETRHYLSWQDIVQEADALNLDAYQRREANAGLARSDETLTARLHATYSWLLVPVQDGTNPMKWEEARVSGAQDGPVLKASRKATNSGQLITQWSPIMLQMELQRWLWNGKPHVTLSWVWDCLSRYLYLSRLQDEDVFLAAVRDGLRGREYFGYASGVDDSGRYVDLRFGSAGGSVYLNESSVLVRPEAALKQLEEEEEARKKAKQAVRPELDGRGDKLSIRDGGGGSGGGGVTPPAKPPVVDRNQPTRFYGSVQLDPARLGTSAGTIGQEVTQHLAGLLGADVEVNLEIHVSVPDGIPESVVRTVMENCRTLKFRQQGFEGE